MKNPCVCKCLIDLSQTLWEAGHFASIEFGPLYPLFLFTGTIYTYTQAKIKDFKL